ncbi:MAG: pyridoxal-dependent decarboxylase, partial [Saprospiraceae bacterium]|nr:pyridoxal-dependent decarboxylase [Saprospiraceae bacterium]
MNKESLLKKAYDPNTFRQKGHELVNQLADLLTHTQNRKGKVTDPKPPEELLQFWKSHSVQGSHDLFQNVIDQSTKVHHPKYIGHQVSVPVPVSALSNLLTGLLNNGMGIYEMGE